MKLPVNYNDLHWTERRQVRLEYVKRQNNKCYHCDKPLNGPVCESVQQLSVDKSLFPDTFFKYPVHLHHDHETGMTIGAVHNYCNAVLWQYFNE